MTARPNAFSGQFDVASRARRSRMLAETIERQQTRIEARAWPPVSCVREGHRPVETKPPKENAYGQRF
jgi:hypothetical protein